MIFKHTLYDFKYTLYFMKYEDNLMDPTCQQGTIQLGGACSGMGRDMEPLIRLKTTLIGDMYISILTNHLCPYDAHCALLRNWAIPAGQYDTSHVESCYRVKWTWNPLFLVRRVDFKSTLLTLDTSIVHLSP